jgi:hypothetical protein
LGSKRSCSRAMRSSLASVLGTWWTWHGIVFFGHHDLPEFALLKLKECICHQTHFAKCHRSEFLLLAPAIMAPCSLHWLSTGLIIGATWTNSSWQIIQKGCCPPNRWTHCNRVEARRILYLEDLYDTWLQGARNQCLFLVACHIFAQHHPTNQIICESTSLLVVSPCLPVFTGSFNETATKQYPFWQSNTSINLAMNIK